jgi:hypothetical protein
MIIWHNNQLHSIVFSGTKQIIFSFRLGLVALPATCYLAPWQWPVTAARPLLSRSRGPLNSAPGAACASPTTVLQPAHGGLLYRTKTMLHFHPRRRPRAPLDARTPSPGYIGAMANPFGIALSRVWTEWAAKQGVSETIAAAVYLLSENRRAEEVVGKLNPSELERVIDVNRAPARPLSAGDTRRSSGQQTHAAAGLDICVVAVIGRAGQEYWCLSARQSRRPIISVR